MKYFLDFSNFPFNDVRNTLYRSRHAKLQNFLSNRLYSSVDCYVSSLKEKGITIYDLE